MTEDQTPPHRPTMGVREARSPGVQLLERIAASGEVVEEVEDGAPVQWRVLSVEDLARLSGRTVNAVKPMMTNMRKTTAYRCGWEKHEGGKRAFLLKDHAEEFGPGPDIEIRPSALSALRAIVAEVVSAPKLWEQGTGSRVIVQGGRLKGVDLYREASTDKPPATVDAKNLTPGSTAEKTQSSGQYKMARQGLEQFPDWLDFIGAVFGDMPISVEYSDDQLSFNVDLRELEVQLLDVEKVNAELSSAAKNSADPSKLRYLLISDDTLGLIAKDEATT